MSTRTRVRPFRAVAIWALFLPVSLNGLGMVCVVPADPVVPPRVVEAASADCSAACALPRPDVDSGAASATSPDDAPVMICLLVPTDHTECMAASTVAMALPVASAVVLDAVSTVPEHAPEIPEFYRDPALTELSPPPKA